MLTRSQMLNLNYYEPILSNAVRIAAVLLFAYIAARAVPKALRGMRDYTVKMMLKSGGTEYEIEKRAETISNLAARRCSS
jgi:hypothetical protein